MLFQLLYMHLYRPFLKYTRSTSPLPAHVSPRKYCTQAAGSISKLFRVYKRTHGLRQICNIAIYIVHSACTIHLLNLPDKNARRDIIHGLKHLEEMGECWTAARRALRVLRLCAERWSIDMPEEVDIVFGRVKVKWGLPEGSSPISPQTMGHLTKQMTSQPVSDLMARNVAQQQHQQRQTMSSIPQMQGGLSMPMAPTPVEQIEAIRSSGNLSMPPGNAAELGRDPQRIRASTHLTKAQQDAWNTHRARLANISAQEGVGSGRGSSGQNAAKLFGGVDSLIEDTQDWFYRDQNQLAMGFENWGEPNGGDWGTLDLSFFDTDGAGAAGAGAGATTGNTSRIDSGTSGSSPAYGGQYYDPGNGIGIVGGGGGGGGGVVMGGDGSGFPSDYDYSSTSNGGYPEPGAGFGGMDMNAMNGSNGISKMNTSGMGPTSMGGGGGGGSGINVPTTAGGTNGIGNMKRSQGSGQGQGQGQGHGMTRFNDEMYY